MSSRVVAESRRQPLKNFRGVAIGRGSCQNGAPGNCLACIPRCRAPAHVEGIFFRREGGFFWTKLASLRLMARQKCDLLYVDDTFAK